MPHRDLKNKPLVEAALEIQWQLQAHATPGIKTDPHYKMLLGRFYERLVDTYPVHETLPAAALPESPHDGAEQREPPRARHRAESSSSGADRAAGRLK